MRKIQHTFTCPWCFNRFSTDKHGRENHIAECRQRHEDIEKKKTTERSDKE